MKRIFQKSILVIVWMIGILLSGCDKEGKNGWLYSEGQDFSPISNLTGESGYGYALLRWDLPEQASQLTMIDVSWINTGNEVEYKKLTHFEDSLWLELEMKDYNFKITSCSIDGKTVTDSIQLHVLDWRTEPVKVVQGMVTSVIENGIYLKWAANNSRSFAKTTFNLYDADGTLNSSLSRTKEESVNAEFTNLEYNTPYILRYYSENIAGIHTDTVEYPFTTDKKAPEMPKIQILDHAGELDGLGHEITTTVYAYSTEIQWETPEPDIDSIRVSFTGYGGSEYTFTFEAAKCEGYLTLLPGGTVALSVYIKRTGEDEWLGPKAQTITTKNPNDTYVFRPKNGPDNNSKLGEAFGDISGLGYSASKAYSYATFVEQCSLKFEVRKKPLLLDELELFPTIETLLIGGTGQPTGGTIGAAQGPPKLEEFIKAVNRLIRLKTIQINDSYHAAMKLQLVEEFTNKEKYPHLTVTDPSGKELTIVNGSVTKK